MNLLKNSLFPSLKLSNKAKTKQFSQNQLKNYQFRQATSSLTDPLLYTFENNHIELEIISSDEESPSTNQQHLRTRQLKRSTADAGGSIVIVEKPVLQDESIQAFAIRYRIPVSQLKRLNNLQNDQDFYALTYCRIPVRRFGLLHESSSTLVDLDEPSTTSIPVTHLSQQNHHAFLNAMDQDLASMRTKMEQFIERPSTTTAFVSQQTLTREMFKPVANSSNEWSCDGADCGCKVWQTVTVLMLIALIPFMYVYFYLKSRHSNKL